MAKIVSPGSSFFKSPFNSAAVQNDLLKMREEHQLQRLGNGGGAAHPEQQRDVVKIYNGNSDHEDYEAGQPIEVGQMALDELDRNNWWFSGGRISRTNPTFGILTKPCKFSKFADVVITGRVVAKVDILRTDHKFAYPKVGQNNLQSSNTGPVRILWKPDGMTGPQDCLCTIEHVRPQYCLMGINECEPCDLNYANSPEGDGLLSENAVMPSCYGSQYLPDDGGHEADDHPGVRYRPRGGIQTVYNPTPFFYPNSSSVYCREVDGLWLIDRYANRLGPVWTCLGNAATNGLITWSSSNSTRFNGKIVEIDSSDPTILNVTCPVWERYFRVMWSGQVQVTLASLASGVRGHTLSWAGTAAVGMPAAQVRLEPGAPTVLSGGSPAHTHVANVSVSATQIKIPVGGSFVCGLSFGDTIKLNSQASGGDYSTFAGTISIEPMF